MAVYINGSQFDVGFKKPTELKQRDQVKNTMNRTVRLGNNMAECLERLDCGYLADIVRQIANDIQAKM